MHLDPALNTFIIRLDVNFLSHAIQSSRCLLSCNKDTMSLTTVKNIEYKSNIYLACLQ
jgi:hypothetical protein